MFTGRGVVLDSCSTPVLHCYLSDLQASLRHSHIVARWPELTTAVCSFEWKGRKERDRYIPSISMLPKIGWTIPNWDLSLVESCRCTFASVSSCIHTVRRCYMSLSILVHLSYITKTVLTRYTLLHWKDEWVSKRCFCSSWSSSQSMVHLPSHCIFSVGNFSMLPSRRANPPCICIKPRQPNDTWIAIFQSFQPTLL